MVQGAKGCGDGRRGRLSRARRQGHAVGETTVYAARKIVTMDPARPTASHVAVRDGRILAVGNADELSGWGEAVRPGPGLGGDLLHSSSLVFRNSMPSLLR